MTSAPAVTSAAHTRSAYGPTRRAARALLPLASRHLTGWLVAPVALAAVAAWGPAWVDRVDISVWQFVLYAPVVASFVLGVVLVAVHLPLYVANGVDRRSFTRAAALAALPGTLASVVVAVAGYAVERTVLDGTGGAPTVVEPHLYTATDQYGLVAVEVLLTMAIAVVAGWLIAVGYYRLGWLWGTFLLLLVMAATVVGTGVLAGRGVPGTEAVLGTSGRIVGAMAVLTLMGLVADRTTRALELRGTTTWMVSG